MLDVTAQLGVKSDMTATSKLIEEARCAPIHRFVYLSGK